MNDIVIDTNVLVHTNNKNNHFNKYALKSLEIIQNRDLSICVDDVFNIDESQNTSTIGHEYIKHIRQGTPAYVFLLDRILKGKIVQIIKKNYKEVKQKLNKKIMQGEMKKPHDIAFVLVACGSNDKLLVSNDYDDFSNDIRKYIADSFSVSIYDSDEYALLTNKEPAHAQA
jgi:predicted nucleic acid-binding protein